MTMRDGWIWPAVLALAGCGGGGGGGGGSGIDPRLARLDIYEAQKLRVLGDPGGGVMGVALTDETAMPASGTASFDGFATIRVETATALVLFGDATVNMTFGTDLINGRLDGFFGNNHSGQVVDYTGAITIDGGGIGGDAASDLRLEYTGALTAGNDTLIFDGITTGSFLGAPISAITTSDLEALVNYNSTTVDAILLILAEKVP